ncbi:hypothetical protein Drose_34995 [Dactylosporangium roseum]|uniref:Carrier domain-containing protein n=1 Tax=Dactylosporangium roseum TaxID=47989 RepID=A0ABY5Z5W3_9ACTN|nr:thioesterase domain-containing protein [Dactylosporangium roseum]UWZ36207.1 hypothetical protein Drose_34995 [Dactylosporangium roseum]
MASVDTALIERTVTSFGGVRDAVAAKVSDISGDDGLVVWMEPEPDAPPIDYRSLRAFLLEQLPRDSVPRRLVPLEHLPRDADGRPDRGKLLTPSWISASVHSLRLLPDSVESRIAGLWAEVLPATDIEVDENFFDLGGSSHAAVLMLARCEAEFDAALPMQNFFERPTIEHLAELLRDGVPHTCMLQVGAGPKRPFICVYPGTGVQGLRLLSRSDPDRPFLTITPHGYSGTAPPIDSFDELIEHYLAEILAVQPHGPYHLGGHCASAIVAYEIASRLAARGETIATFLAIKAAPGFDLAKAKGPEFFLLDELFASAAEGSAAKRIEAFVLAEAEELRSPQRQAAALARMRPMVADLHRELLDTAALASDHGFERFAGLVDSWAWYLVTAGGHRCEPSAFPVDVIAYHGDRRDLTAAWSRTSGHVATAHLFDSDEPFEAPEFARWLTALLDERDSRS